MASSYLTVGKHFGIITIILQLDNVDVGVGWNLTVFEAVRYTSTSR